MIDFCNMVSVLAAVSVAPLGLIYLMVCAFREVDRWKEIWSQKEKYDNSH